MSNYKSRLSALYRSEEIHEVWQAGQNQSLIKHPKLGMISPNEYRAQYHHKPCPFCGKKMVHNQNFYSTYSQQEAVNRGYQYQALDGTLVINQAGKRYFHPNYVTLDHKLNKARFPSQMFDYDNLQVICWKCNREKSDNNAYELEQSLDYIQDLVQSALDRYPLLP